jgi:hypothetical protein
VRVITRDIIEDAKSTIENMRKRADTIEWRKGLKQGCL